jgi:hypothetical protein
MSFRYAKGVGIVFAVLAMLASACSANAQTQEARVLFSDGFDAFKRTDYKKAVELFSRGLKLDPTDYRAHYFLASTYSLLSDSSAIASFQEVVKIAPSGSFESRDAIERLEWLRPVEPVSQPKPRKGQWVVYRTSIGGRQMPDVRLEVLELLANGDYKVLRSSGTGPIEVLFSSFGNEKHSAYTSSSGAPSTYQYLPDSSDWVFPFRVGSSWERRFSTKFSQLGSTDVTHEWIKRREVVALEYISVAKQGLVGAFLVEEATESRGVSGSRKCWFVPRLGVCAKTVNGPIVRELLDFGG